MQIKTSTCTLFTYSNMAPQSRLSHNNSAAALWAVTLPVTFPLSVNRPATHSATAATS